MLSSSLDYPVQIDNIMVIEVRLSASRIGALILALISGKTYTFSTNQFL